MDSTDLLEELNIRIGDTDDFTFTENEKSSALTEAINDSYVVSDVWDSTTTFSVGTYQYDIPSGVDTLTDIYIKPDNNLDEPVKITSNFWEVVEDNIHFKNNASAVIPDGYTLHIRGKSKYTSASTIAETSVQEYVLTLAQLRLYKIMLNKKSMRFLKNDTSVSEIVAIKRELEQDVIRYRQMLPKVFQAV